MAPLELHFGGIIGIKFKSTSKKFLSLILSFALGQGVEPMLNQISTTDATYFLSFAIWNFVHYVIINGFFIVFMTVLFLNRVWKKEEDKVEHKKIEVYKKNDWKQIN